MRAIKFIMSYFRFLIWNRQYNRFNKVIRFPVYGENTNETHFDKHYVYHVAWAIRKLKEINPQIHIDISSSLYFSVTASAFFNIKFYDYRLPELLLDGLEVNRCNILSLSFPDNSVDSISCMHVIEHIGLGRYGDELDYMGDIKAVNELKRVLKNNGYLMFVVPLGNKPLLFFNAHRVYTYNQVIEMFSGLELLEFALITSKFDSTGIIVNPSIDILSKETYGCGCFLFKK